MRTVVRPKGRLPARVYWFRRSMVLVTALALVFAVGRLLTGSGGSSPETSAVTTGSHSSTQPVTTPTPGVVGPLPVQGATTGVQPSPTGAPVALAVPSGPCALDEITVTPSVPSAVGGSKVPLVLELTGIKPACTFSVSSETIVAKVTAGHDRIWSSQDCPASIKPDTVVVRSAQPSQVVVTWSGRRSDDQCTRETSWAVPGYYHLIAAVIGSEPNDVQFRLAHPPRQVVTKTAKPRVKKKQGTGTVCGGDNAATSC